MVHYKIVLIAKSFSKGGAASGARNLKRSLEAAGHKVICLDGYEQQRRNVFTLFFRVFERVIERCFGGAESHFIRLWKPTFNLKKVQRRYSPDIIQLCDVSGNTVKFSDIAQVTCPVIHRMSDFWPYRGPFHYLSDAKGIRKRVLEKLHDCMIFDAVKFPDVRVAPSEWLAGEIPSGSKLKSPVKVIRNAVFSSGAKREIRNDKKEVVFGFISNEVMDHRKGFDRIIPYLSALFKLGLKVHLDVYGGIKEKDKVFLKEATILYHGKFRPEDVPGVYSSFNILLCPSRLDNSPNVVTEAQAYGCPVIGQLGTGMASYITDKSGFLVDFGDFSEKQISIFCSCVTRILDDYDYYSKGARNFAITQLSPKAIGREYTLLYESLL